MRDLWRLGSAGNQRGMVLVYVLVMTQLMAVVTVGIMLGIASELGAGVHQIQAVKADAVAEGGLNHAIAKLADAGGSTYTGETITIQDGSTVIGTAVISVTCPNGGAIPCTGGDAPYRKITSTGTAPGSTASRTVVSITEGTPVAPPAPAACGGSEVEIKASTVYGDVSGNGPIVLSTGGRVRNDPPLGLYSGYNGDAKASGSITCPQGCGTQVMGTTTPNMGGTVCTLPTLPTFTPGATDQTIAAGTSWTMNSGTGYSKRDIILSAAGTTTGCTGATPYSDFRIQTGAAGTTTVVQVRKLTMGRCGRLIIDGPGNVELRVQFTGQPAGLSIGQYAQLGVLPPGGFGMQAQRADSGRLTVYALGSDTVVQVTGGGAMLSGTFKLSNGELEVIATSAVTMYGSVAASLVDLGNVSTWYYEPPTGGGGGGSYSGFNKMRSWKDQ